jgi:hypothetical protein
VTRKRITLDFSDDPTLLDLVRAHAVATGKAQREVFFDALTLYFSLQQADLRGVQVVQKVFEEWDNEVDAVYDFL